MNATGSGDAGNRPLREATDEDLAAALDAIPDERLPGGTATRRVRRDEDVVAEAGDAPPPAGVAATAALVARAADAAGGRGDGSSTPTRDGYHVRVALRSADDGASVLAAMDDELAVLAAVPDAERFREGSGGRVADVLVRTPVAPGRVADALVDLPHVDGATLTATRDGGVPAPGEPDATERFEALRQAVGPVPFEEVADELDALDARGGWITGEEIATRHLLAEGGVDSGGEGTDRAGPDARAGGGPSDLADRVAAVESEVEALAGYAAAIEAFLDESGGLLDGPVADDSGADEPEAGSPVAPGGTDDARRATGPTVEARLAAVESQVADLAASLELVVEEFRADRDAGRTLQARIGTALAGEEPGSVAE